MSARMRTAFLMALLAVPAALTAQEQAPPPEVQEMLGELQQIQQQLEPLQQQALLDPAVQQEQQRAVAAMRAAMVELDPTIEGKLERFEEIMEEAQQAQAAGDQEKIVALTDEAQQIQPDITRAQQEALAHPAVEPRIEAFQANLREKMVELDPEAKPLLDRLARIEARLRAVGGDRS